MLDPNFDPYEELLQIKTTLNNLINAHNEMSNMFVDLSSQHQRVTNMLGRAQKDIQLLYKQIKILKEDNATK
jgi:uncharacterized coiled-coil DUF342 family protein